MTTHFDPVEVLRTYGQDDYIGEPVSQLEHALQCAALAVEAGASDELVVAALFHDIGHLCAGAEADVMPGLGVLRHEYVGADYLESAGYPETVCELVRGHVEAKRFLVATKPDYARRLSLASQGTLALQGGPLAADELERFVADPLKHDKLRLRMFDERAKVQGAPVPDLERYAGLLARVRNQPR